MSLKMRLISVFLLFFLWMNDIYGKDENINIIKFYNHETESEQNLFIDENYRDSMFFNKLDTFRGGRNIESNDSETNDPINCLGLGGKVAKFIESFFIKEANGTKALKVMFYATSRLKSVRVTMQHGVGFSLDNVDFDIKRRTIFVVHGFLTDANESWIMDMEKALLLWGDINLFVVDWSDGSNTWNYLKAAVNTKTVSNQIATFITQLTDKIISHGYPQPNEWGPLHLIGHSLGAHICGRVAYDLKIRKNIWPVQRITGLDPAQPCFRHSDLSLRLDRNDANFVDIIHTNGRLLKNLGLGLPYPLGHVDFYPNGGSVQPGCILTKSSIWKYLPLPIEKIAKTICSHGRSQIYFTESVIAAVQNNCTFWGQEWDMSYTGLQRILSRTCKHRDYYQCIEMGINAENYPSNGTYFVPTGNQSPYCQIDEENREAITELLEKKDGFIFDLK